MKDKRPAILWYVGDWRKDSGVQALDYEARGVWFELIQFMYESERRGYLTLNGKKYPDEALAQALGLPLEKTKQILTKILDYGVASKNDQGVMYCRRMVRDADLSQKRAESGKKGGKKSVAVKNTKQILIDFEATDQAKYEANIQAILEYEIEYKFFEIEKIENWKVSIFLRFYLDFPGEKDDREASWLSFDGSVREPRDITRYLIALGNYKELFLADHKGGKFNRRLKNASTWFRQWTEYEDQGPHNWETEKAARERAKVNQEGDEIFQAFENRYQDKDHPSYIGPLERMMARVVELQAKGYPYAEGLKHQLAEKINELREKHDKPEDDNTPGEETRLQG